MFNKKLLLFSLVFLFFCSTLAGAQMGIGVILGAPTGLSFKFWQSRETALDLALAWDFNKDYFHIHGDYLYHFPVKAEGFSPNSFFTYIGIGARMMFKSDSGKNDNLLGVRGVGGIEFLPPAVPLDVFLEIAPVVNLIETTDFDVEGGIGLRYKFNL